MIMLADGLGLLIFAAIHCILLVLRVLNCILLLLMLLVLVLLHLYIIIICAFLGTVKHLNVHFPVPLLLAQNPDLGLLGAIHVSSRFFLTF